MIDLLADQHADLLSVSISLSLGLHYCHYSQLCMWVLGSKLMVLHFQDECFYQPSHLSNYFLPF